MKIILASKSPFRKRAMEILGLKYETVPSTIDEKSIRDSDPLKLAKKLSEAKARDVGKNNPDTLVIAGDLFIVLGNVIFEKPQDDKEGFAMLQSFSGKSVEIVAGIAVYNSKTKKMLSSGEKYTVKFRKLLDYEIHDYVKRYPVTTLAGAFEGDALIRFAETSLGKYPFLTGLPMNELILFLRENGLKV